MWQVAVRWSSTNSCTLPLPLPYVYRDRMTKKSRARERLMNVDENVSTLRADFDDELPDFTRVNSSFTVGDLIWIKHRTYPYWPALVSYSCIHIFRGYHMAVLISAHLLNPSVSNCPRHNREQFIHFRHAPLWVRSAKRRHQPPEWTILSHVSCFIQGEVHWFQVLLGSLHPRSTGRAGQITGSRVIVCPMHCGAAHWKDYIFSWFFWWCRVSNHIEL